MKAVKFIKTVKPNGHLQLDLPDFCNQQIEIVILPLEASAPIQPESLMTAQEQSGFAQAVLADPAEDIWNEL